MKVYLIGFMGSGKSKKGRKLAAFLQIDFIDLDDWIEKTEGTTISAIFKNKGESYFRKIEFEALQKISLLDNVVVATGGGSPCFFDAIEVMNQTGLTIYLKANASFLRERLMQSKKKRPLLENLSSSDLLSYIENKLLEREFFYSQAKFSVEAITCNAKQLAELIKTAQLSA